MINNMWFVESDTSTMTIGTGGPSIDLKVLQYLFRFHLTDILIRHTRGYQFFIPAEYDLQPMVRRLSHCLPVEPGSAKLARTTQSTYHLVQKQLPLSYHES
jgi:hypothetical protein